MWFARHLVAWLQDDGDTRIKWGLGKIIPPSVWRHNCSQLEEAREWRGTTETPDDRGEWERTLSWIEDNATVSGIFMCSKNMLLQAKTACLLTYLDPRATRWYYGVWEARIPFYLDWQLDWHLPKTGWGWVLMESNCYCIITLMPILNNYTLKDYLLV